MVRTGDSGSFLLKHKYAIFASFWFVCLYFTFHLSFVTAMKYQKQTTLSAQSAVYTLVVFFAYLS